MNVAEIREWATLVAPIVTGLVTLFILIYTKKQVQQLTLNVDGRLTALLAAKEAEGVAKAGEASAVGEAKGRADVTAEQARIYIPGPAVAEKL